MIATEEKAPSLITTPETPASSVIYSMLNSIETPTWSHDEYHANKSAVSCTALKKTLRSPAHLMAYRNEPNEETTARLIGTALHAAVLEPVVFSNTFVEYADGMRKGKKYEEFVLANQDKTILKSDEWEKVIGMRNSIMAYTEFPIPQLLVEGENESTIVWTDKETGVRCKVRPDNKNRYSTLDLKTTGDSRPYEFVRQCVRLDYDLQAFMYQEGVLELTGERREFYFIAVETNAPYSVWVHQASPAMLASGEFKFRKALAMYKECLETGLYPGYHSPSSMIEWPKYA